MLSDTAAETLFKALWRDYETVLQNAKTAIEKKGRIVEVEAYAANMELDGERHQEIKKLVGQSLVAAINLPCYFIPYSQNAAFFGRETELKLCRDALASSTLTASSKFFVLHGIGGVGKTSIALQFAYEQKLHRKVVLWFPADNPEKLDRRFSEIAHAIGLHHNNADQAQDREGLKRWLDKTSI